MRELRNHQVILWNLKPEGTCGVGDHSRLWVKQLGGRIIDVSKGETPDGNAPQLIQYTPVGWTQRDPWIGGLEAFLRRHPSADRTIFLHELRRRMTPDPRTWWPFTHDLLALRMMLPTVNRILVTTEHRARQVTRMMQAWGLEVPVHVVAVCSNVHENDPSVDTVADVERDPDALALFARSTGGVLGRELGDVVKRVLEMRPSTKITLLGDRGFVSADDLVGTLQKHGVVDKVRITGMLPAEDVARELMASSVGLALHDTGVSGRRGTISAMLASGVPVVTGEGEETDAWTRSTDALLIAADCNRVDADAVARAVAKLLDEKPVVRRSRRRAAVETYLMHCGWTAMAHVMGQGARAAFESRADGSERVTPWVA